MAPSTSKLQELMKEESAHGKHTYLARRQTQDWIRIGLLEPDGDIGEQTKLFLSLKKLMGMTEEGGRVSIQMFKTSQRLHLVSVWPGLLDWCRITSWHQIRVELLSSVSN